MADFKKRVSSFLDDLSNINSYTKYPYRSNLDLSIEFTYFDGNFLPIYVAKAVIYYEKLLFLHIYGKITISFK